MTRLVDRLIPAVSRPRFAGRRLCRSRDDLRVEPASPAIADVTTGQFSNGRFTLDTSTTIDYKLFCPPSPRKRRRGLLVMLHGCTQNPDDFAIGTRMNNRAGEHGLHVLYPAQPPRANAYRCWNWFDTCHQQRDGGEPRLLAELTRSIVLEHAIDPDSVFVAGLSAGGSMAAILGDTYPDLFAAVGVHSGVASGTARSLGEALRAMRGRPSAGEVNRRDDASVVSVPAASLPVRLRGWCRRLVGSRRADGTRPPTIVFHGSDDSVVHPNNGNRVMRACLQGAGRDIAPGEIRTERREAAHGDDLAADRTLHRDAHGQVLCEHWLVLAAGHAWSGGDSNGTFADARGPDASAEMIRFFLRQVPRWRSHRKRAGRGFLARRPLAKAAASAVGK